MSRPTTPAMAAHLIATAGASPDPDTAGLLASMFLDRLRYPAEGGAPAVVDREGNPVLDAAGVPKSVESLIGDFRRELPQLFTSAKPASPAKAAAERGMNGLTARAAAEHAAAQQRATTGQVPNPYAPATRNLTLQVMMETNNPAMAAEMKAAARE